jgi:hypothetical protein
MIGTTFTNSDLRLPSAVLGPILQSIRQGRFSLRAALLAITCLALLFAVVSSQMRRETTELALAAEIQARDGYVELERRVDTLGFQCLTRAMFNGGGVDEELLSKLGMCNHLRILELFGCHIQGSLALLNRSNDFEMLNLGGATLDVGELRHLARLPRLDAIWLDGNALGSKDLGFLRSFPRLKNLLINRVHRDQWNWRDIVACEQLEQLSINNAEISADDLDGLAQLHALRHFSLSGCLVTDNEFTHVAHFRQLESLGVQDCNISLATLREFRQRRPQCEVWHDYNGRPLQ